MTSTLLNGGPDPRGGFEVQTAGSVSSFRETMAYNFLDQLEKDRGHSTCLRH
ncbi:MAG: hypothetical protein MZV64_11590 [Ignavibacteriales bacterium]|nr:hypothetical protein [Ignavibacteriales bacterium]